MSCYDCEIKELKVAIYQNDNKKFERLAEYYKDRYLEVATVLSEYQRRVWELEYQLVEMRKLVPRSMLPK